MATRGVSVLAGRMADTIDIAAAADAAGYDAAWTGEFSDRSAIVALAAMAQATSRCRIGSAIAYGVGPRSPPAPSEPGAMPAKSRFSGVLLCSVNGRDEHHGSTVIAVNISRRGTRG